MPWPWISINIFLPGTLSPDQVSNQLRAGVVRFAADGGEFVDGIRIEGKTSHADGWFAWRTSYRPGPPGLRYGSACAGMTSGKWPPR